jgi:hypothetical protein
VWSQRWGSEQYNALIFKIPDVFIPFYSIQGHYLSIFNGRHGWSKVCIRKRGFIPLSINLPRNTIPNVDGGGTFL